MSLKVFILLLFTCWFSPQDTRHNLNLTVTDIQLSGNTFHIKIKFFADDLQGCLTDFSKQPIDLVNAPPFKFDAWIHKYVQKDFGIFCNEKKLKFVWGKAYLQEDVYFVEFSCQVPATQKIKSVKIRDVLLFESFPEQKNYVHMECSGQKEHLLFEVGDKEFVKPINCAEGSLK